MRQSIWARNYLRAQAALSDFHRSTALHPGKDLAVSFPFFYLYNGTGPTSLRLGPPFFFKNERFCSHLYPRGRRALPATLLSDLHRRSVPTFLPDVTSGLSLGLLLSQYYNTKTEKSSVLTFVVYATKVRTAQKSRREAGFCFIFSLKHPIRRSRSS